MEIDTIREQFSQPPAEFGPTPFWFLNDELDEGRLSHALEDMKAKGIAGVVMHPRSGMEVEYLSETYWARLRHICETLKRLEMQGWIYDEYNWPSGPVGGILLRERPEFRQFGLDYRVCPASQVAEVMQTVMAELAAAFAITPQGLVEKTVELKRGNFGAIRGDKALLFFLRDMRTPLYSTYCAPWTKGERGYLDLLNPDAVDEFMRLTHFEYDRHLKEYYGNPLVGIFTDEPANYAFLPFTPAMPDEFQKRYERDFWTAAQSLAGRFPGMSVENHIRNRTNYFELARDLYVESFFQKIADWAAERGLLFTGHLYEEDNLHRLPATNVSFYGTLSRMSMPGTDILSDKHGYMKRPGVMAHGNFNPKALSSTAHHSGAKRTLSEIWGGNGWSTPPEKLKAVLNWAQACGVNFINPHASFMSLRGLRKRDFPASHSPPQPWWKYYDKFSEYIARLSYANSQGHHVADVLFAYPMKSLWAGFDLRAYRCQLADFFEAASEGLLRSQQDFDYLFDEVADSGEARIEDKKIVIEEETYSLLLLPLAPVIPRSMLELAEKFSAAGGKVIAFGYETPSHDEYGEDVSARMATLLGDDSPDVIYRRIGSDINADVNWLTKAVRDNVRPDLIAEGPIARNLIYLHRRDEGIDSYFIANLSDEEGQVDLAFQCKGRPQVWDPETGTTKNVLAYREGMEYVNITTRFEPNQALFYVFTDQPRVDHVESTNLNLFYVATEYAEGYTSALEVRLSHAGQRYTRNVEQAFTPITLSDRWETEYPVANILLLDEWDIEILSAVEENIWSPSDDPRLRLRARLLIEATRGVFGLKNAISRTTGKGKRATTKYEPLDDLAGEQEKWLKILGIDESQFEEYELTELLLKAAEYTGFPISKDFPPPGSEFAMSASFEVYHIPDDLALVYERFDGAPKSILINDQQVDPEGEQVFIWDNSNVAVPISRFVKKGANRLRIEWRQPSYPSLFPSVHGIEPVCLTGTFWVKDGRISEQKYAAPLRPWDEIGLPNYIGTLTYKSSFEVPMNYMSQQLFLKFDRIETAAEVKINENNAGVILWKPYVLDVTDLLRQGENSIEITVANSAANLLAKPVPAGLIGRPYIVPYWRHRIRFTKQ